jgi:hypothetical protein
MLGPNGTMKMAFEVKQLDESLAKLSQDQNYQQV